MRTILRVALAALPALCMIGCSQDENPITPEKMIQIRQKEQNDRKNFNPTMSAPPSGGK